MESFLLYSHFFGANFLQNKQIRHTALYLFVRRGLEIFIPCVAVRAVAFGYVVEAGLVVAVFSQALPDLGVVKRTLCERFELLEIVVAPDTFIASVVLGAGMISSIIISPGLLTTF
jgi:hypothetical protein